ncbi:hypothetical protein L1987_30901 [Smallanthus sonchifolius]|uniref:Uncharacterized protein n=1 Tax=Smallanthus sonchifolius TaxID=185202 RepID=A0ACB9I5A1_9ASTR|nr:hypothetical protein L1987_30901 [Smallanthus sonchifolius]
MLDRTFLAYTEISTTLMNETMVMLATDSQNHVAVKSTDLEFAKCDCCGLTEECTPSYIENIRARYLGNWLCRLCGEAMKDEIVRSERLINTEEAMTRHMNFCRKSPPSNPGVDLIAAMRHILRRSLDSPRTLRSMPNSPLRSTGSVRLSRSESCITDLTVESSSYIDLQEMMK